MVTQGVTSVILGEATTPAPSNDKVEELEELAKMEPRRAELQRSFRGEHRFKTWLDAIDHHPNSVNAGSYLGAATVRITAIDGTRIQVRNLEALDGTPILDVKPLLGEIDER